MNNVYNTITASTGNLIWIGNTTASSSIIIPQSESTSATFRVTLFDDNGDLWCEFQGEEFPLRCEIPLEGESTYDILETFIQTLDHPPFQSMMKWNNETIIDFVFKGSNIGSHVLTYDEMMAIRAKAKQP